MLFATTTLAARIERAECSLLEDSARAIAQRRAGADVIVQSVAGGVATYCGAGSPLNKVAGLGFGGPVSNAELDELEHLHALRGSPVQVELSSLADAKLAPALCDRGYRLVGFENVLGRPLAADRVPSSGELSELDIAVIDDEDLPTWVDTVVTAFAAPDEQGVPSHESFPREALEQTISDMAQVGGLVRYLAIRDGAPAGGASMRLSEGIAQLTGAATLPAHRRRGIQTALLARRLADGASAECDVAVVTTQPGSKSQENVQKKGFELLYTRAVLVRDAGGA